MVMNEPKTEAAELLDATRKALALLATSVAVQQDARVLLAVLEANYRAAQKPGPATAFDDLMVGMLLSVSSTALKQHPDDPETKALYQGLRAGRRH